MRVLVTGGAGFIGSHVVDRLLAAGHSPTIFDLRASPYHDRHAVPTVTGDLCDLDRLTESVEIGFDAPGFVRPSYGIGLMTDPGWPGGLLIGHGGGGPGYAAATFAVLRERSDPLVAIELSGDERVDVQTQVLDELRGRSTSG